MNYVLNIFKEQILHLPLIFRIALYDLKSKYQMHYLGVFWQLINPMIQVLIYWFVFGIGFRASHSIEGVPYFIWLIIGLIPWFFISPATIQGSNSIYNRVNLVSKMKFPVSVLPSISIVSNIFNLIVMSIILGIVLLIYRINPGIYLIQLPYYILCMLVFLFAVTLLFSTISTIIRDFQFMLQSLMRMLFFLTPILWDIENLSHTLQAVVRINPFVYIIEGFRNTFLLNTWFYHDLVYTVYFWCITLFILLIGSVLHENFKTKFVDYL